MNRELQQQLYDKYPSIFIFINEDMRKTAMCWGIECDDGWYDILDKLCENIVKSGFHIKATQVKEKFGTLRFYTNYSSDTIDNLIENAEKLSEQICEVTGKPGELMSTSGNWHGWLKTLSPEAALELGYKKIEN